MDSSYWIGFVTGIVVFLLVDAAAAIGLLLIVRKKLFEKGE